MSKNIPIVIIHTGYKDYLKINLEITDPKLKKRLVERTANYLHSFLKGKAKYQKAD